jgi:hypothetical protein
MQLSQTSPSSQPGRRSAPGFHRSLASPTIHEGNIELARLEGGGSTYEPGPKIGHRGRLRTHFSTQSPTGRTNRVVGMEAFERPR